MSPPPLGIFHRCPSFSSSKLVKAIHRPSRDHAGDSSTAAKEAGVSRRGVPPGRSTIQSFPAASKVARLPSGEREA